MTKGFSEVLKSVKEVLLLVAKKVVPCYSFTSLVRFGLEEANYGWGKPTLRMAMGAYPVIFPISKSLSIRNI